MKPITICRHDPEAGANVPAWIVDAEELGLGYGVKLVLDDGTDWALFRSRREAEAAAIEADEEWAAEALEWMGEHETPADFWRWSRAAIRAIGDEIGTWDPKTAVLYRA